MAVNAIINLEDKICEGPFIDTHSSDLIRSLPTSKQQQLVATFISAAAKMGGHWTRDFEESDDRRRLLNVRTLIGRAVTRVNIHMWELTQGNDLYLFWNVDYHQMAMPRRTKVVVRSRNPEALADALIDLYAKQSNARPRQVREAIKLIAA